jgi:aspartate--ammonia ligase
MVWKMKEYREKSFAHGHLFIPEGYRSYLTLRETEEAIRFIKTAFQNGLSEALNLSRVSSPLFVLSNTGVNDHLNGVERPVSFTIKDLDKNAEIVQSLAKWKRAALSDYGFKSGEGLYTDMNAIRPDERLDNLHSIYVDQWDWERVIKKENRNVEFLKGIVRKIYGVIYKTEKDICRKYKKLPAPYLLPKIHFVHTEELEEMYPHLSPRDRENAVCREKGAVFIIGIGAALKDGKPHDGRASDYDDWSTVTGKNRRGLNGDIFVWNPVINCAFELSSMGIRVDKKALLVQLEIRDEDFKKELYFHQRLLKGKLPLTIGGGIGESRLCMLFLRKAHVGEVQSSIWPEDVIKICGKNNINLL